MSDAIKPCPFCGSVPQKRDVGDYFVTCPGCGIDGPAGDSDGLPHAADAWNTRADSKLAAAEARAERLAAGDVPEADFGNMLDCRTCAHFTADGCNSTVMCMEADQYKATVPRRYWATMSGEVKP